MALSLRGLRALTISALPAIRRSPINVLAPSDKSDEPSAGAQRLMNQIRCGASGIVIDYPACVATATRIWNLAIPQCPNSICKSLMAKSESGCSVRCFKRLNPLSAYQSAASNSNQAFDLTITGSMVDGGE